MVQVEVVAHARTLRGPAWKVMDISLSGLRRKDISQSHSEQPPKMSMIAMATPSPHAPFRRDFWDDGRSMDYAPSRPRSDADGIALPSIRQVAFFPALQ